MRVIGFSVALLVLAGCLGGPQTAAVEDASVVTDNADSGTPADPAPASQDVKEASESDVSPTETVEQAGPQKPRRGLLGLFARNKPDGTKESVPEVEQEEATGAEPEEVSVPKDVSSSGDAVVADPDIEASDTPRKPRRGLFGPRRSDRPDSAIAPGTVLPFGEIGVVCGLRGQALGKEVDRFPAKGKGYRLYDSNPSSTLPRTHYLTGFKDGCARQFTASLVLIGSPVLHEQMRYDPSNKDIAVTEADKAYERIKRRICKVSKGEPCPEKHVAALEKGMAFVTLYERFGSNASWEEVLLHNGQIAGTSLRRR